MKQENPSESEHRSATVSVRIGNYVVTLQGTLSCDQSLSNSASVAKALAFLLAHTSGSSFQTIRGMKRSIAFKPHDASIHWTEERLLWDAADLQEYPHHFSTTPDEMHNCEPEPYPEITGQPKMSSSTPANMNKAPRPDGT